jgi:5-hydroxyisourate hydrolase
LKNHAKEFFYTQIPIVFKIEGAPRKYHVPLLLNPFGYSTYRGS